MISAVKTSYRRGCKRGCFIAKSCLRVQIKGNWPMVGWNYGIEGGYASLGDACRQIGTDKDIINSFGSSRVGRDIIMGSVTV